MNDPEEQARVEQGRRAAIAWLATQFPNCSVHDDGLDLGSLCYVFRLWRGGTIVHVVELNEDFLSDQRDQMADALQDRGLVQRLQQAGTTPVRITA